MTLDTEPTVRIPIVDIPSATITNSHALRARAAQRTRQRTRTQKRWDLLAQVLSYLCFAGILVCLVGISVAGVLLALSMADQDGALPAPESTTTASLTLPSMPSTAYPLLGGVALDTTVPAATAGTTRAVPRPTSTTGTPAAAASTTTTARETPPVPTTVATLPATTTTTTAPAPSSTEPATTTSSTTTTAGTEPPPVPTDPSTTTTEPATPPST